VFPKVMPAENEIRLAGTMIKAGIAYTFASFRA